jgi:hypothetical protein
MLFIKKKNYALVYVIGTVVWNPILSSELYASCMAGFLGTMSHLSLHCPRSFQRHQGAT